MDDERNSAIEKLKRIRPLLPPWEQEIIDRAIASKCFGEIDDVALGRIYRELDHNLSTRVERRRRQA